jgi:hypothetical protein
MGLNILTAKPHLSAMLHCTRSICAVASGPGATAGRGQRAPNQLLIEKYLSNIYRAEIFRQPSYASLAATGVICGFAPRGSGPASAARPSHGR